MPPKAQWAQITFRPKVAIQCRYLRSNAMLCQLIHDKESRMEGKSKGGVRTADSDLVRLRLQRTRPVYFSPEHLGFDGEVR